MQKSKLDNPVYHSLEETHRSFRVDYDGMHFYQPAVCPFGGYVHLENTEAGITQYAETADQFYIVGDKPHFSHAVSLNRELVCIQMVMNQLEYVAQTVEIVELRSESQKPELFSLVSMVLPGFFKNRTSELGNYYGIYKDQMLVSVVGERMKMEKYTEVSAVVTHPLYTGIGFSKQLLSFASRKIMDESKTPYLHVAENNPDAIHLYEKMGFRSRRKMSFWHLFSNRK